LLVYGLENILELLSNFWATASTVKKLGENNSALDQLATKGLLRMHPMVYCSSYKGACVWRSAQGSL